MNLNKETYERLLMDVTKFDTEDIITTSGEGGTTTRPAFAPTSGWELPVDM